MIPKKKKDSEKKRLLPLVVLSLLFYGVMLLLTLTAKDIHNARLPQVTASRLSQQQFTYTVTQEDGHTWENTRRSTGIPKDIVDSGQVFIISTETKYGTTFYYARQIFVTINEELSSASYYALDNSSFLRDMVILTGYEELEDGDEVHLLPDKK